jgi:DNA mismatch endonuclease (patch repair protein)
MDNLTKEQRRKNMQAIKASNTKIEKVLGKALWTEGLKYRKNDKNVYGKPDFTFKRFKLAVFCDSEFWHGKNWEKDKNRISTNSDYWRQKINNNIKRDKKVNKLLRKDGWTVIRFWGKAITKDTDKCVEKIKSKITIIRNNL